MRDWTVIVHTVGKLVTRRSGCLIKTPMRWSAAPRCYQLGRSLGDSILGNVISYGREISPTNACDWCTFFLNLRNYHFFSVFALLCHISEQEGT